jgi:hypothetical protein
MPLRRDLFAKRRALRPSNVVHSRVLNRSAMFYGLIGLIIFIIDIYAIFLILTGSGSVVR